MVTVDWQLAERVGLRLHSKGPQVDPPDAHHVVAELRELAQLARDPVRELTGLEADPDLSPAVVVDRGEWIRSNLTGFQVALAPLLADGDGSSVVDAVGSRVTGLELGAVLSWLSGKVLGQYEAFVAPGQSGRLLLVAPNIVQVERELDLVPRDFRYWVCLHEETHRAQFGGVPWLSDYFLGQVHDLIEASDVPASEMLRRITAAGGAVVGAVRGSGTDSLMEAMQTPAQRVIFDRLTGLMSLLEGHADYVMDEVGPTHVPTVAVIRERFEVRRKHTGSIDGFARRLLGMEAKLRQYSQGAAFVRGVIERSGPDGFAQVWAAAENLPTAAEIEDPDGWTRRVLG